MDNMVSSKTLDGLVKDAREEAEHNRQEARIDGSLEWPMKGKLYDDLADALERLRVSQPQPFSAVLADANVSVARTKLEGVPALHYIDGYLAARGDAIGEPLRYVLGSHEPQPPQNEGEIPRILYVIENGTAREATDEECHERVRWTRPEPIGPLLLYTLATGEPPQNEGALREALIRAAAALLKRECDYTEDSAQHMAEGSIDAMLAAFARPTSEAETTGGQRNEESFEPCSACTWPKQCLYEVRCLLDRNTR